jgi:hypothetical protein
MTDFGAQITEDGDGAIRGVIERQETELTQLIGN